jgi:meso-butanediol dehydrogenase / (S,S)-butanediol dehydrogenase / diacetyl reductase
MRAGTGAYETMSQATEASYDRVFNLNAKGVLFGINCCAAAMRKAGTRGAILVNSSALSQHVRTRVPLGALYSASKAAGDMFVRYAAMEHAEAGARHSISMRLQMTIGPCTHVLKFYHVEPL